MLVPSSAFDQGHLIRAILDSARLIMTKSGEMQGHGGYFSSLVSPMSRSHDAAQMNSGDDDS